MAVDGVGNIYITNYSSDSGGGGSAATYNSSGTAGPTLTTGVSEPFGLAVHSLDLDTLYALTKRLSHCIQFASRHSVSFALRLKSRRRKTERKRDRRSRIDNSFP